VQESLLSEDPKERLGDILTKRSGIFDAGP